MQTEQAKGPGYMHLFLKQDELLYDLLQSFKQGKPLSWPLVSRHAIHRIWSDFSRTGKVQDERGLDNIFALIRDNVVRLRIANIVSGHEQQCPAEFLEDELEPDRQQAFCDWLVDYEGGWRISDYGIGPLTDALALAHEARTSEARLKYLDRALHVTHMRGDLSKLFVEGGRKTVTDLEEALEAVAA